MVKSHRYGILVSFIALLSFGIALLPSYTANAIVRAPRNAAEQSARDKCYASAAKGTQGAIWFGSNNHFYDGGYDGGFYEMNVNVPAAPGAVTVYIHGSADTCEQSRNYPNRTFYAINVRPGTGPEDYRLFDLSGYRNSKGQLVMSRGTFTGSYQPYDWTSIPSSTNGYIQGKLNVDGLVAPGETKDIKIGLYRCPSYDMINVLGSCGTQQVVVRVTRAAPEVNWNISGDTDVVYNGVTKYYNGEPESDILVAPNSNVTFRHYIKNNGPDATNASTGIWSDTIVSGGLGVAKGGVNQGNLAINAKRYSHTDTISIGNAPNGSRYCQRVGYQPRANGDGSYANGPNRCVRVNYSYNLTPVVTADPSNIAQAGQDIKFSYLINNNTSFTANPTNWRIRQTVTSPTGVVTSTNIQSGTNTFAGSWTPRPTDTVSNTFPAGSTVCRYLSVNSSTEQPNVPAEAGACVLVAYSPYFTAVGGNVWAGGSTVGPGYTGIGSVSGNAPSTFGSFGEYGVFATGDVTNFGSGGLLGASGLGMTNGSRLTFANVSPKLGSFSSSHRIPERSVPTGSLPPNKNWSQVMTDSANEVFYIPGNGNYDIDAAELPLGKRITIYANNRTVRINGNITYAAGATGFAQLPSLTVVAKSIEVGAAASEVAGYFYVTDSFVTCSEGPRSSAQNGHPSMGAITTTGPCYTPLTVNGAVTVANNGSAGLVLNRSSGGDASGTPAEMFRMRPEVFLTGYEESRAADSLVITTVHETELSPRY